jgi:hypothetical protein
MATSDLPRNYLTGEPRYELEDPLERLQTMLNRENIDIESLDRRGPASDRVLAGTEDRELRYIKSLVDANPEYDITSARVNDLNDYFDKDISTNNPNYIFRDDRRTRNNVDTIRRGIQSFVKDRDLYVTPPATDTQTQILELLKN